jgi:flagellar biosynthesis anti-sigma factor FlgM
MIISNQQVQNTLKIHRNSRPSLNVARPGNNLKPDKLELSPQAQEVKKTIDLALKSPEIRADKVDEIKKQIQAGTYHRSSAEIASKMFDRSLVDEFARR